MNPRFWTPHPFPQPSYFCDLCWTENRATTKKVEVEGILLCPVCDDEPIRQKAHG